MIESALKQVGKIPPAVWIAAALGVGLYVIKKGGVGGAVAGVTAGVITGAGEVVKGAGTGAVLGIGDLIGLPRTTETACQKAMREGNNWQASLHCDAKTFLAWQARGAKKTLSDWFSL